MVTFKSGAEVEAIRVSLVDGDPEMRHARQLVLRSENFDVQSYATSSALLADPGSRDYPCIVLDAELTGDDGVSVLRQMRTTGWRGRAILLVGPNADRAHNLELERAGDKVMDRNVGDNSLMAAIAGLVDRGWNSWNAAG